MRNTRWNPGDVVAIVNPVSCPDGYDIAIKEGETATITQVYDDGFYAVRLHSNGLIIDFHRDYLRLLTVPAVKYLIPKSFAYPLSVAAALCMLFASEEVFGPTKAESTACAGHTSVTHPQHLSMLPQALILDPLTGHYLPPLRPDVDVAGIGEDIRAY